ncbi:MAG: CoA pyrophosphatase [Propionibacteriaceae bacterium]|nr:CoA pyrophosphatase [Propionibacteriaceae bacterium]
MTDDESGVVVADWAALLSRRLDPVAASWRGPRPSSAAVLVLLSDQADPDLVLTVRSDDVSHHAGQVSFPGGRREPGDQSPTATALRETCEEIGLAAGRVTPLGQLSTVAVPVSANLVIPVVGLWSGSEAISVQDAHEVAAVMRCSLKDLTDPAHRVMARHPDGDLGPAWRLGELFVWGLTGHMIDTLLRVAGWERNWDRDQVVEVPPRFSRRRHDG